MFSDRPSHQMPSEQSRTSYQSQSRTGPRSRSRRCERRKLTTAGCCVEQDSNRFLPFVHHPTISQPANMEISVVQRTLAVGKWLMHASEKPVTELHKAALS